jgi:hypothetical protein
MTASKLLRSSRNFKRIGTMLALIASLLASEDFSRAQIAVSSEVESELEKSGFLFVHVSDTHPKTYIVVFKDNSVSSDDLSERSAELLRKYGGTLIHVYRKALPGFVATLTEDQASKMAADPRVKYVEEDKPVRGTTTSN